MGQVWFMRKEPDLSVSFFLSLQVYEGGEIRFGTHFRLNILLLAGLVHIASGTNLNSLCTELFVQSKMQYTFQNIIDIYNYYTLMHLFTFFFQT